VSSSNNFSPASPQILHYDFHFLTTTANMSNYASWLWHYTSSWQNGEDPNPRYYFQECDS